MMRNNPLKIVAMSLVKGIDASMKPPASKQEWMNEL
jgi:hypothetical protein